MQRREPQPINIDCINKVDSQQHHTEFQRVEKSTKCEQHRNAYQEVRMNQNAETHT